jgi:predicted nucleic acid-binding protein
VTVLDTSAALDYLLGEGVAREVGGLLSETAPAAAPQLLVFEVLAVMRREVARGGVTAAAARALVDDVGDLPIELFPMLPLRGRAFELRENLTAGDALFVALAEALGEPLVTKDRGLARAATAHSDAEVVLLG